MRAHLLLLSLGLWPCIALAGDPFAWPQGRKAAVSLAYDDALPSHLDTAIPALDRHGLKGSFYLQLSRDTVWTRNGVVTMAVGAVLVWFARKK